jgi:hypothetical protein
MILDADPVQAPRLDLSGYVEQRVGGVRDQEVTKGHIAAVVGHLHTLSRRVARTKDNATQQTVN